MKNLSIILVILVFLSATTNSCKKQCKDPSNPECPNYDPCFGKSDVSADFNVLSEIAIRRAEGWLTVDAEISQLSTWLLFKAKDSSYKSYEWSVGSDMRRWRDNAFTLSFSLKDEQIVPVTLIVEGDPNKNCTEKKDWRDTLIKQVRFIDYSNFVIFGEYRGALTNKPTEEFNVKIKARQTNSQNVSDYISGLPFRYNQNEPIQNFYDTIIRLDGIANNTVAFSSYSYNSPNGIARLNTETNEITIEYDRYDPYPPTPGGSSETWPRKTFIFKGIKIK